MPYFRCYQTSVHRTFVIDLLSKQMVKEARDIVDGVETRKIHVMGTLIKEPRPYNWPWSWHLDPSTIEFFENATEVCDASVVDALPASRRPSRSVGPSLSLLCARSRSSRLDGSLQAYGSGFPAVGLPAILPR